MRSSYGHHYRRMLVLVPVLDALRFQSNNNVHRPVIEALDVIKANRNSRQQYYDAEGSTIFLDLTSRAKVLI